VIYLEMERRKFLQIAAITLGAGALVTPKPTEAQTELSDVEIRSVLRDADLLNALNRTRDQVGLPPFEIDDRGRLQETQIEAPVRGDQA